MKEWKIIPGFDGRYRISEAGIVQSCNQKGPLSKRAKWWDMKQQFDRNGYNLVYLWNSKAALRKDRRVRRLVHQLVAELFLENPNSKPYVNHIDGNKSNPHFQNLEWKTPAENMGHAWRTGLCKPEKLNIEKVREILSFPENDTRTAAHFGVSQVWVTKIRQGKAWSSVSRDPDIDPRKYSRVVHDKVRDT